MKSHQHELVTVCLLGEELGGEGKAVVKDDTSFS